MSDDQYKKLVRWFVIGDTGMSSKAVAGWLGAGIKGNPRVPSDGGDFGRCYDLIDFMDWHDRLTELAKLSGHWAVIVENWQELVEAHKDGDAYKVLRRIEVEGYERDGYTVRTNRDGSLSSATKDSASVFDMGGGASIRFGA